MSSASSWENFHLKAAVLKPLPSSSITTSGISTSGIKAKTELLLLDTSCPQIASLLAGALLPTLALPCGPAGPTSASEAVAAISQLLRDRRTEGQPLHTLHLVAHGKAGAIRLGRHWLDAATLTAHAAELSEWRLEHLALWSCHTGADANFVSLLEELTGARIWSSTQAVATQPQRGSSLLHESAPSQEKPPQQRSLDNLFAADHLAGLNVVLADVNILFETGSIGTVGTNPQKITSAVDFHDRGIERIGFFQPDNIGGTADGIFNSNPQGNDIPGYLRIWTVDGSYFDIPGAIVWRLDNSADQYGFITSGSTSFSYSYTANGTTVTQTIVPGTTNGTSTNILLRSFNSSTGVQTGNISGNAATSGIVTALNTTLAAEAQPSAITGSTVNEGTALSYTVTLDNAATNAQLLSINLTGTATPGTTVPAADYNNAYSSFSFTALDINGNVITNGIINNGDGTITLATGVKSFTMTIPTFTDQVDPEANETVILSFGGAVSGTGTILNAPAAAPVCFLPGTLIATPSGLRPVETLQPGDLVLTPEGPEPVRFLGYSNHGQRTLRAIGRMPVAIQAGAFGELGPERHMYVSPSHALHLQGALVEAGALINGSSIRQLNEWPSEEQITYYSIELERHALVWANGLLAESFYPVLDLRLRWHNHHDYVALYGENIEPMQELALPRIPFARQLPAELRALAGLPDLAEPVSMGALSQARL